MASAVLGRGGGAGSSGLGGGLEVCPHSLAVISLPKTSWIISCFRFGKRGAGKVLPCVSPGALCNPQHTAALRPSEPLCHTTLFSPIPALPPLSLSAATDTSVGDFQILLWTGVLLVAIVLGAVYALVDMGSAPLDAQIRTISAEKKGGLVGVSNKKQ